MAIFVCFSTDDLEQARSAIVADATALGCFRLIEVWDEVRLKQQPEYMTLSSELKVGRGFGYFWWKPFIIRKAIDVAMPGELVFYSDCGRYGGGFRLDKNLLYLLDKFNDSGFVGVEVPQFGSSVKWVRKECIAGLGVDEKDVYGPQIQATFSLWKKEDRLTKILLEWEQACRVPSYVADVKDGAAKIQNEKFIENRHDQAILTLLTRKYNLEYIDIFGSCWPAFILRLIGRFSVAHTEPKRVGFVVYCLMNKRGVWPLFCVYIESKIGRIFRRKVN